VADFEFDGRQVTVVPPRELTLGDLAYIKQNYAIDSQVDLEDGLGSLAPDAWRALLIVSIRRVDPKVTPNHGGIDGVSLQPVLEAMNKETLEWMEAKAAEDEAAEDRTRPTGGRTSTPAASGPQTSA
jgi:hypothetical protein